MARKGNPISVRRDLNRSSDSSWFSDYYYSKSLYQDVNQTRSSSVMWNVSVILCKVMHNLIINIVRKVPSFYPCLFLLALITPIFIIFGEMELFLVYLSKAFIAAGSRTISSLLIKMGLSGGLALAVGCSIKILIGESCNMMVSSASGSGEGFRWTDLFGSSSPSPEASLNQPAPDSPNPGEPAAPIAEVYHPLQEDGQRRRELRDRLTINTIGRPLPEDLFESIIDTQFQTEQKIEKALRSDRVHEDSFIEKRHQIRGILFYPTGRALSLETYMDHLNQIQNAGTHRSLPYRRLRDAISSMDLELDFDAIKKRRDW